MSDRKPADMTWESFAEEKIPGRLPRRVHLIICPSFIRPILGPDEPHDEWWWIKRYAGRKSSVVLCLPPCSFGRTWKKELAREFGRCAVKTRFAPR